MQLSQDLNKQSSNHWTTRPAHCATPAPKAVVGIHCLLASFTCFKQREKQTGNWFWIVNIAERKKIKYIVKK